MRRGIGPLVLGFLVVDACGGQEISLPPPGRVVQETSAFGGTPTPTPTRPPTPTPTPGSAPGRVAAVIGDYGSGSSSEGAVATLVKSWNPDLVLTVGDNNYNYGEASTIDANIGQFYHEFIFPYVGNYGPGATENRFFPSLGNHDWIATNAQPYLDYFTLSGNERYYEFASGAVHLFMIDSDPHEPDGTGSTSVQGNWLKSALARATEPWKLVLFHHAPYSSSSNHGSTVYMQWPFQTWGASAVLAGHDHTYERILKDGFPYFVNGLGGASRYSFGTPVEGSQVRYSADYGAMRIQATATLIRFEFFTRAGTRIDQFDLTRSPP